VASEDQAFGATGALGFRPREPLSAQSAQGLAAQRGALLVGEQQAAQLGTCGLKLGDSSTA